jgi:hypothetical protein
VLPAQQRISTNQHVYIRVLLGTSKILANLTIRVLFAIATAQSVLPLQTTVQNVVWVHLCLWVYYLLRHVSVVVQLYLLHITLHVWHVKVLV